MSILRRILGVFVMLAGIVGLLLSIAGLVGIYLVRPVIISSANQTIMALTNTIDTSQKALDLTGDALSATVESVDALAEMLGTTADSVEETQPIILQVNQVMGESMPTTVKAAEESLMAAGEAATSLEGAIKSFEIFQALMSGMPLIGSAIPAPTSFYSPEKPLAESLTDLAISLEDIPAEFEEMSANMDKADDNLALIKGNLDTMASNVAHISESIEGYQAMLGESEASMEELRSILETTQANLPNILNYAGIGLGVFFLWLLAAQVVIFSQGWELFQGTAGRMESGAKTPVQEEPAPAN